MVGKPPFGALFTKVFANHCPSGLDVGCERKIAIMKPFWVLAKATWKMELSINEMGNLILYIHMVRNMWPSPQPGHKISSDNSSPFQLFSFFSLTFLIQACPQEKRFYQNLTGRRKVSNSGSLKAWESWDYRWFRSTTSFYHINRVSSSWHKIKPKRIPRSRFYERKYRRQTQSY